MTSSQQSVDFPVFFIRADMVDNTKPKTWVYARCLSNTAVNGYFPDKLSARTALKQKLCSDIENNYKAASTYPSVYASVKTELGPKADINFKALTAGTAGESITVAYTAATASTTATVAACTANSAATAVVVTLAVSGSTVTATANAVTAAIAADTGAGAHAANFLATELVASPANDGTGKVKNMSAITLKQANSLQGNTAREEFLNALVHHGEP